MWDAMSSWLTPKTLFILLNFIIATIYLTSHKQQPPPSPTNHNIPLDSQEAPHRTTSIIQKFKSINFTNFYTSQQSPSQTLNQPVYQSNEEEYRTEDQFDEAADDNNLKEIENDVVSTGERSIDEVYSQLQRGTHNRSKSDMEPASFMLLKSMKKSASTKSVFNHFKEAGILEASHPETAEDGEVDLKADNFINRFKQQLELQRRNSMLHYKKILGRGAEK